MKKLLSLLFLSFFAQYSFACSPLANNKETRSFSQQLDSRPLAFIGIVKKVTKEQIIFYVEANIKGAVEHTDLNVKALPASTCNAAFEINQRWLYAGSSFLDGNTIFLAYDIKESLDNITSKLELGPLKVIYKDKPYSNTEWNACETSEQCTTIGYACSIATVNMKYKKNADNLVESKGVSPKTVNCFAPVRQPSISKPLCIQKQCAILDLN